MVYVQLVRWCSQQRWLMQCGALTRERRVILDNIGFDWKMQVLFMDLTGSCLLTHIL
jgi:hypothetical protein